METLLASSLVSEVVVDTDSETILEEIPQRFPDVRLIRRPESLRAGTVPMNDVIRHDLTQMSGDVFLQTHSTNPLLRTETIDRAIRDFLAARDEYDSLFSVTPIHARLWDREGEPMNHDPAVLIRTQDLEPVYEENSCIYLFTASSFEAAGSRIGSRPMLFEVDPMEAWDIDDEIDFEIAEFLQRRRGGS